MVFGISKKTLAAAIQASETTLKENDHRIEATFLSRIDDLKTILTQSMADEFKKFGESINSITEQLAADGQTLNTRFKGNEERLMKHVERMDSLETSIKDALKRISTLAGRVEENNKTIDDDITVVKNSIEDVGIKQKADTDSIQGSVSLVKEGLKELHLKQNRIVDAVSGDFYNLAAYRQEKDRDSLRHHGTSVEWIVKNIKQRMQQCAEGYAITSPSFTTQCPKVGEICDLQLAFYPKGERGGGCSLFLRHPIDAPWIRFNLTVGSQKRGPFDTIYKGPPIFCDLNPEIGEGLPKEWDAVRLSVEFIPPMQEETTMGEERAAITDALYSTSELVPGSDDATNRFFQFEKLKDVMTGKYIPSNTPTPAVA